MTSYFVVVIFGVFRRVFMQLLDEGLWVALDDLISVDEIKVDVT